MSKFRVIELFGGIGACTKALKRLGVDVEVVDYVEIDKYATQSYNAINGTNFEPQDITEWHKHFEDIDLIMHGSPCFVAGTKVLTDSGYKNVEDVSTLDRVLTHTGTWQSVVKVGHTDNQAVYQLRALGIIPTNVTGNHPYYVKTRTKYWDNDNKKYRYEFSSPIWKSAKSLSVGDYLSIPIIREQMNPLGLDSTTCWLLGRYVADGHIRHSKRKHRQNSYQYSVVYSIGEDKVEEFKEHLGSYHASIYSHSQSTYRAVISDMDLVKFIEESGFGMGAMNKDIPNFILQLPNDLAESFLDGYMSGDGCCTGGHFSACSISSNLISKLQLLVAKLYKTCGKIYVVPVPDRCVIEGREVNQHTQYQLVFDKQRKKQCQYYADDNYLWIPFRSVAELSDRQTVYNLEIGTDNSYTANNVIVHNCQDFSISGRQAGGDENSGTRSSLMYETVRIVEDIRPKYVLWENVKNLLSDKHIHNYRKYQFKMEALGYNNYSAVLNAKDYALPQNRERVFTLSIRKDVDGGFNFPYKEKLNKSVQELLETNVDESYFVSDKGIKYILRRVGGYVQLIDKNTVIAHCPITAEGNKNWTGNFVKFEFPPKQKLTKRLKDVLETDVDEKYYLPDDYLDPIIGSLVDDCNGNSCHQVGTLSKGGYEKMNDSARRVYADDGISPAVHTVPGGNTELKVAVTDE